jgi:hypothetical protein
LLPTTTTHTPTILQEKLSDINRSVESSDVEGGAEVDALSAVDVCHEYNWST